MRFSAALTVCCGKDAAELERRAAAIGQGADRLRATGLYGSPAQIVDTIGAFASVGTSTVYLQVLDLSDLDHLALIASEVAPQVTGV